MTSKDRAFKRIVHFAFLLTWIVTFGLFSAQPAHVHADSVSPVAYWKMEAGSGSSVVDSSGHGHDLHLVSAPATPTWTNDTPTLQESNAHALAFDGADDYSYAFPITETVSSSQLTVEAWVKFDSFSQNPTIASAYHKYPAEQWWFGATADHELAVNIADSPLACCSTDPHGVTVGANLQTNQWYHVAFVYNGSGATDAERLNMYVNDVALSTAITGSIPSTLTDALSPVLLGNEPNVGTFLRGNLDEVRIYTVARSATDISDDYNGQTAPTAPPPSPPSPPAPVPGAPIAYWKMEAGTGDVVADSAGYGHDQSLAGDPAHPAWSTDVPPVTGGNGYSLAFDGVDDYASASPLNATAGSPKLTVEAWVKFDSFSASPTIASAYSKSLSAEQWWFGASGEHELAVNIADSPSACCSTDPHGITVGANLQANQWYHVAFVYDGSGATDAERLKMYLNGMLLPAVFTLPHAIPPALMNAASPVLLGNEPNVGNFLHGNLDEVRIYTVARSSTDIANDAAGQTAPSPPDPVPGAPIAYWKMEEGSGTRVVDSAGNGYDQHFFSPTASPQWSSDVPPLLAPNGYSLAFDGVDDTAYSFPLTQTVSAQQLTVEAWVKFQAGSTFISAFDESQATQWAFGSDGGSELQVYISDNPAYPFVCCVVAAYGNTVGANLHPGQWYHVAFVYDGTGTDNNARLKAYVNGVSYPVAFNRSVPTHLTNAQPVVRLGYMPRLSGHFQGNLDEVRIYTVARSSTDIINDSLGQIAPTQPPPPPMTPAPVPGAPIAYWKMEEGSGTRVVDSAGNEYDQHFFSPTASPQWSSDVPPLLGPNAHSLAFDGVDDTTYAVPLTQTVSAQQLSVEAWVKAEGGSIFISTFDESMATQWAFGNDGAGELLVYISDNPAYPFVCCAVPAYGRTVGANLQSGQWYHVAFVYDGRGTENNARLKAYVDGVSYPVEFNRSVPTHLTNAQPVVRLGYMPRLAGYFQGKLDEVRIYTVARSSTDIINDYNGQTASAQPSPPPMTPAPVPGVPIAYWKMEEGSGGSVVDSAGNGHEQFLDPSPAN